MPVEAATGLPLILCTAALVVAGCFRLLVALLRPPVSAAALFAAWRLTCLLVRPLHRLIAVPAS